MSEEIVETREVKPDRYADFADRALARIIDLAVLSVLALPLWGIYYLIAAYGNAPSAVLFAWGFLGFPLYIAYFAIMTARTGQTVGKRIMGLQVQGEDGRPPSAAASLWRAIIDLIFMRLLMLAVGFIDYLWLYRRKDCRTLHDLAVGTSVKIIRPWPDRISLILLAAILIMQLSPQNWLMLAATQGLDNMSPTIRKGEWWAANRLAYRRQSPQMGDVVVFKAPFPFASSGSVGRIVGLPGDELLVRGGRVERVLSGSGAGRPQGQVTVPRDYLAILGDNRATPEAGGYPLTPVSIPPPPPPPSVADGRAFPIPQPRPPWPNNARSPILMIKYDTISGKVIGVTSPLWRTRTVR